MYAIQVPLNPSCTKFVFFALDNSGGRWYTIFVQRFVFFAFGNLEYTLHNWFFIFRCPVCTHHRPNDNPCTEFVFFALGKTEGKCSYQICTKSLCFSLLTNWSGHFTTVLPNLPAGQDCQQDVHNHANPQTHIVNSTAGHTIRKEVCEECP